MKARIVWDWTADCSRLVVPQRQRSCLQNCCWQQVFECRRQNAVVWHGRRRRADSRRPANLGHCRTTTGGWSQMVLVIKNFDSHTVCWQHVYCVVWRSSQQRTKSGGQNGSTLFLWHPWVNRSKSHTATTNAVFWSHTTLDIRNWHSTDTCMGQEDKEDPRKDAWTWWRTTANNATSIFIKQHRWLNIVRHGGARWRCLCQVNLGSISTQFTAKRDKIQLPDNPWSLSVSLQYDATFCCWQPLDVELHDAQSRTYGLKAQVGVIRGVLPAFVTGIHKDSVRRWNLWLPSAGVFTEVLAGRMTGRRLSPPRFTYLRASLSICSWSTLSCKLATRSLNFITRLFIRPFFYTIRHKNI